MLRTKGQSGNALRGCTATIRVGVRVAIKDRAFDLRHLESEQGAVTEDVELGRCETRDIRFEGTWQFDMGENCEAPFAFKDVQAFGHSGLATAFPGPPPGDRETVEEASQRVEVGSVAQQMAFGR